MHGPSCIVCVARSVPAIVPCIALKCLQEHIDLILRTILVVALKGDAKRYFQVLSIAGRQGNEITWNLIEIIAVFRFYGKGAPRIGSSIKQGECCLKIVLRRMIEKAANITAIKRVGCIRISAAIEPHPQKFRADTVIRKPEWIFESIIDDIDGLEGHLVVIVVDIGPAIEEQCRRAGIAGKNCLAQQGMGVFGVRVREGLAVALLITSGDRAMIRDE